MEGVDASVRIALIAHDQKKDDMIDFCKRNQKLLQRFELVGTGTTARLVSQATGSAVQPMQSGPRR